MPVPRSATFGAMLGAAALAAVSAQAQTDAPGAAPSMDPFARAVILQCAYSHARGVGIADLPESARQGFHRADADERKRMAPFARDPNVPVWTSDSLGSHLNLAELSADRCLVVASGLPVEPTFRSVMAAAQTVRPDWRAVPIKGGYNPIAYQLERNEGGKRYVIHLEGSEPGGLGHMDRMLAGHAMSVTLLIADVIVQPAAAKPPHH